MDTSQETGITRIETGLLLEAVYQRYGYDFRGYAVPSLNRRIQTFMIKHQYREISGIIPDILRDEALFDSFIRQICVSVTEMFRDPAVFRQVRQTVMPFLASFPSINIWHAGCATGEEAYSLAILLAEEGLLHRATIYATDMDQAAVHIARQGIYPLAAIQKGTANYKDAGGRRSFSDYYHARYGKAILSSRLKRHITFACHNLATDAVFNTMHLVLCRNVLIYFNRDLQNRVLGLLSQSLDRDGVLILGTRERLDFSSVANAFHPLARQYRIYKKTGINGKYKKRMRLP